jgi:hypothetical protein
MAIVLVLMFTGAFAGFMFIESNNYSKIKRNYGKNERDLHANGRERTI